MNFSVASNLLLVASPVLQALGVSAHSCAACVGYKGCTVGDPKCKCRANDTCKKKEEDCNPDKPKWGCHADEECEVGEWGNGNPMTWGTCKHATEAQCTREVWSIVRPSSKWGTHVFHPQVWYHTLEVTHDLWKEDYFDYVLDVRPLSDIPADDTNGVPLLEGWETFHIPGSYPIDVPASTPAADVAMLVDFTVSNVCKDARVFVHCWSGQSGNAVAKTLIELGFTNVHAAGPEGSAGIWDWKDAGYPLTENDHFHADEYIPSCVESCAA